MESDSFFGGGSRGHKLLYFRWKKGNNLCCDEHCWTRIVWLCNKESANGIVLKVQTESGFSVQWLFNEYWVQWPLPMCTIRGTLNCGKMFWKTNEMNLKDTWMSWAPSFCVCIMCFILSHKPHVYTIYPITVIIPLFLIILCYCQWFCCNFKNSWYWQYKEMSSFWNAPFQRTKTLLKFSYQWNPLAVLCGILY